MPDYNLRIFQLSYFIKTYRPKVYYHIKSISGIDLLFQKWIMTIFSGFLPFEYLFVAWHFFVLEKWIAIFKISIILLAKIPDEQILNAALEDISLLSCDNKWVLDISINDLIHEYLNFYSLPYVTREEEISEKKLSDLREEYYISQVKDKLDSSQKWDRDQVRALEIYLHESTRIEKIVNSQISVYKKELEELNKQYQSLLSDFQYRLKEFNDQKQKLENLIEERVGLEVVIDQLKLSNPVDDQESQNYSEITNAKTSKNDFDSFSNGDSKISSGSRKNSFGNYIGGVLKRMIPKKFSINGRTVIDKWDSSTSSSKIEKRIGLNNGNFSIYLPKSKDPLPRNDTPLENKNVYQSDINTIRFNDTKSRFIELKENKRIFKMLKSVNSEIHNINLYLKDSFLDVDSHKHKVQYLEQKKNTHKKLMEDYISIYQRKERELLKQLSRKLRDTDRFKQRFEF